MLYELEPVAGRVVDVFDRDAPPAITVQPGDRLRVRTLDASGHLERWDGPGRPRRTLFPTARGHCLAGPIHVEGAESGDVLAVRVESLATADWGYTVAGGHDNVLNRALGTTGGEPAFLGWSIADGRAVDQHGSAVATRPFLGVIGTTPAAPGEHSTIPPRSGTGGNVDCRELVAGSTLYLPVEVPGAGLCVGDGHAAQGDGEVGGTAIECGMTTEIVVDIARRPALNAVHAETPTGRIVFGFDADLNAATTEALGGILTWMQALLDVDRNTALAYASVVVDPRHPGRKHNLGRPCRSPPRGYVVGTPQNRAVGSATERVLRQRLATQRLTSAPLDAPGDVVRLLTCVQSQERDHAFFSLGLRTRDATFDSIREAHDRGEFVRTHILRPTWHFVVPEDLRWILALTSPRVERSMGARHRELGLDDERFVQSALESLQAMLSNRTFLTRAEIGTATAGRSDFPAAGPRLGHLLMLAELRGAICSGPTKGGHHTYALIDEIVPPTPELERDDALARLVHRFFGGHGPAAPADFTRWSSLTLTDCRRGIEVLGDALACTEVDGTRLWFDPECRARRTSAPPEAWLFPTYDEVVLTYPSLTFAMPGDHPRKQSDDPFWARIVCDTTNIGLWKRRVERDGVVVTARLAPSVDAGARRAVQSAAERLATFLGRPLIRIEDGAE